MRIDACETPGNTGFSRVVRGADGVRNSDASNHSHAVAACDGAGCKYVGGAPTQRRARLQRLPGELFDVVERRAIVIELALIHGTVALELGYACLQLALTLGETLRIDHELR